MEIPGVGPLIATAEVATMEEASAFKSGREFAAYVGLVPNQTGSCGSEPAGGYANVVNHFRQRISARGI